MFDFKIGVLEPDYFNITTLNRLLKIGEVYFYDGSVPISDFIIDIDVLYIRLLYKIDDFLIRKAKKLKYIVSPTTGINHINITNNAINVISLMKHTFLLENVRATPEHILGLMIALLRKYKFQLDNMGINKNRYDFIGDEIFRNKIGIIGYGRIGKILSKYLLSLEADVYFYDIDNSIEPLYGATKSPSISDLINKSNVVILSVNYNEINREFFDKDYFDLLKGKYFINASRAELCNERDFCHFLGSNEYLGVAIDVYFDETNSKPNLINCIRKDSNVLFSPHIGGLTTQSLNYVEELVTDLLLRVLKEK